MSKCCDGRRIFFQTVHKSGRFQDEQLALETVHLAIQGTEISFLNSVVKT